MEEPDQGGEAPRENDNPRARPKPSDAFLPQDGDDEDDYWNASLIDTSFLDGGDNAIANLDDEELDMEHPGPIAVNDLFDEINNDDFDTVHPVPGGPEPDVDASSIDSVETGDDESANDSAIDDQASIDDAMSVDEEETGPHDNLDNLDEEEEEEEEDENKLITFSITKGMLAYFSPQSNCFIIFIQFYLKLSFFFLQQERVQRLCK